MDTRQNNSASLFNGKQSNSLSSRAVEYIVEKYAYYAKLVYLSHHILRHTFLKSLVDAGESLDRVAILAGHENLNTTAKYTRPTATDLQKSVDKLIWE